MADTGYSVFAPYARVPPDLPGLTLARESTVREPGPAVRCDHTPHLVLGASPLQLVKRTPEAPADEPDDSSTRRTKIWEFSQNLHCSIVGTCLSTTELRQTLSKLGLAQKDWTDHDLHHKGVSLAARHDQAAKLLNKALDRRHKLAISQAGRAKTEADLTAFWRDAVKRGDIPGAYWAVLTHPAATQALVRLAFGEVHMLSHLVGAANRADIRRLCELEEQNALLTDKLTRQQDALRQAVSVRDASIQDLRQSLRQRLRDETPTDTGEETAALRALAADLEKRLAAETRRRASAETKLSRLGEDLARERAAMDRLEAEAASLRTELAAAEAMLHPDRDPRADEPDSRLDGLTLLYVGGRPNQIAHLRDLAERHGAAFLHHDGGVEHHPDLLAGLTSRADTAMFPVDCVSHDAALMVKRLCRQAGKTFMPLRSSGATSFLAALRDQAARRPDTASVLAAE